MYMKKILLTFAAVVAAVAVSAQNAATVIIPRPLEATAVKGQFVVTPKTVISVADEALVRPAEIFAGYVAAEEQMTLAVEKSEKKGIVLSLDSSLGQEEYTLEVTSKGVSIKGGTPQGVFYGLQSLRQMLSAGEVTKKGVQIEAVSIKDKPLLGYRGAMLDVCRHFFTVDEVKTVIDAAAMHKMNRLHWHITEDQGWRIEIKKYPKLTEIGSVREDSQVAGTHRVHGLQLEGKPYGPYFYTQDEIREVVAYAAERFITVVPEIDMPGHMVAALASYPHLGCLGEEADYKVWTRWGISDDVLCIGKESTFEFIEGVLAEVLELFPSEYIHIGGDECPRVRWTECPHCKKRMKKERLQNEAQLQTYFNHRVEAFLQKHGRKMIGWDEILEGGVSPTTTVMSWRGTKGGIAAAKAGNQVIMTPTTYCYLDYPQGADTTQEPAFGERRPEKPHYLPLTKVYSIDPYDQLTEDELQFIIGVQGNLWTEHVPTFDHAMYMFLPRMSAIAESGWSHGNKDFERYAESLNNLVKFYDAYGYNYAKSFWREGK